MSFWDFISPDKAEFDRIIMPWLPADIVIGPVVLDRQNMADLAYYNPASIAGLVARSAYSFVENRNAVPSNSWAAGQALADNLNRGGLQTPGPAFAGSDLTIGNAMAPLVIANTYEVTVRAVCGSRAIDNVFFCTSSTRGLEATVASTFLAAWKVATTGPLAQISQLCTLVGVFVTDIATSTGGQASVPDTTAGGKTGGIASRAVCALVQFNGNNRNRSTRGRTYLGPLVSTQVGTDGATIVSASATAIGTAFTNLQTTMSTAGFPMVIASRKLLITTPVTLTRVSTTIATQRHRLRS